MVVVVENKPISLRNPRRAPPLRPAGGIPARDVRSCRSGASSTDSGIKPTLRINTPTSEAA
eukprot:5236071-Pyramimonas_sp.AAC.1